VVASGDGERCLLWWRWRRRTNGATHKTRHHAIQFVICNASGRYVRYDRAPVTATRQRGVVIELAVNVADGIDVDRAVEALGAAKVLIAAGATEGGACHKLRFFVSTLAARVSSAVDFLDSHDTVGLNH
jgi:hypothetical protein